ncbi:MAG: YeeE/YedE family protein [Gemmatimonadetes bacterium]|nr:YeeE/YedE family protein [Gemmatimonadota bacterium]
MVFGFVLIKSEAVSWFRIQEMFRFQSFHMYGIVGSAVLAGMISLQAIRRLGLRTARGEAIAIPPKERTPMLRRYWIGGGIFGLGWALLGACPGPMFALIGSGATVMLVAFASALAGTWAYASLRPRLPH